MCYHLPAYLITIFLIIVIITHHRRHHYCHDLWPVHRFVWLQSLVVRKSELRHKSRPALTLAMGCFALLRLGNSFLHKIILYFLANCNGQKGLWLVSKGTNHLNGPTFTLWTQFLIKKVVYSNLLFRYLKTMLSRTYFSFCNYFNPSYLNHKQVHLIPGKLLTQSVKAPLRQSLVWQPFQTWA